MFISFMSVPSITVSNNKLISTVKKRLKLNIKKTNRLMAAHIATSLRINSENTEMVGSF